MLTELNEFNTTITGCLDVSLGPLGSSATDAELLAELDDHTLSELDDPVTLLPDTTHVADLPSFPAIPTKTHQPPTISVVRQTTTTGIDPDTQTKINARLRFDRF
jgi:hypothetical protein